MAKSLREVWVNDKKGLQKMSELTEQLHRVQRHLHEDEDRVEELESELEEQRILVRDVTAQRDKAEEEVESRRHGGSRLLWQKSPQESRTAMEHFQLELEVEDLQVIVNVLAGENEGLKGKLAQKEARTMALTRDLGFYYQPNWGEIYGRRKWNCICQPLGRR